MKTTHLGFIVWISCVAALGGLLFGYDTAVVAGTVEYIQPFFGLSDLMLGWTMSSALVGCIFGAAAAGWFGDRFGRKPALFICAVLFLFSAIWSALAGSANELVLARILGGIGVGAASLLTPVYITEIAPSHLRGALTTLNQMAILIGMVSVYLVSAQLAQAGDETWRLSASWRWMFGSGAFPALLFLLLLFGIPESPRWLVLQKQEKAAAIILERIGGERPVSLEIQEIHQSFEGDAIPWRNLFTPPYGRTLLIGALLAISPQVSGINVVMYYAPRIFTQAGVATSTAIGHSVFIGLVMLVFTTAALFFADKFGRRPLLLISSGGMTVSLAALGATFGKAAAGSERTILFWILSYVAFFSIAMGPLVWTVVSEIFPNRIRGRAASICVLLLWLANFLVSQFFPFQLARFGSSIFWIYAIVALASFGFIFRYIPETRGKSLEELEKIFG